MPRTLGHWWRQGIQAMKHDTSTARVLSGDFLLYRSELLIETATTTFTETLDGSEQAAASRQLFFANQVWHQWTGTMKKESLLGRHTEPTSSHLNSNRNSRASTTELNSHASR